MQEHLDPASIDIVLTSPFYATNKKAGKDRTLENTKVKDGQYAYVRYDKFVDNYSNEEYCEFTVKLFQGFDRILKKNGVVLYNINYGSALFKSTVRYGAATLEDNNAAIQLARHSATEANKQITASAGQFTLSGILIGGQDQTVGWNYLPKTNSFTYVIYDKAIVSATIPAYGETGTANYTLVWDNYNSSLAVDGQMKVYVALELVNNTGEAFWGRDNLIRQGGTFYLVGELDPTAGGLAAITWPTNYALPPYRSDVGHEGETLEATRVFIQDYMTSADFVIGATSLQNAYVTVPDLRSTQISLGLSVDLAWSTGLNFGDVNL